MQSKSTGRKTKMILLLRVIDERCGIDLLAGTIVVPIEAILDRVVLMNDSLTRSSTSMLMTPNEKIMKIRDVPLVEIATDDPSRNAPDPTRELRISCDGSKEWYKNDQLHRDAQPGQSPGPAVECADGTKEWYKNGQPYRDGGPAYEGADGTKMWYKNGYLHCDDGPAIEYANGTKEWYKNGQQCRIRKESCENMENIKPTVALVGEDGNVFSIIGRVARVLKKAGQRDRAAEFVKRAMSSSSYDAVLNLVSEYCEVE